MKVLLALLLFTPFAHASTYNERVIGEVEVCPGILKVDVLLNDKYLDTYYWPIDSSYYPDDKNFIQARQCECQFNPNTCKNNG